MGDAEDLKAMREEIDELSGPTLPPRVTEAAGRARDAVSSLRDAAGDRLEQASEQVRGRPFVAILIAVTTGYLLGRYIT